MSHDSDVPNYIESGLGDLRNVGPEKPVGYLPLSTLTRYFGSNASEWVQFAMQHHLEVLFPPSDRKGKVREIYLYHRDALQALLTQHTGILDAADWPSDPEEFIKRIAIEYVPEGTPLFDLIADAFGDKDNPCRSDRQ
jgi:hypothetical protein